MMPFDFVLACALDAAIGDPRWFPHPVRGLGYLIDRFERMIRRFEPATTGLRLAGLGLAIGLPSLAFLSGWALIAAGTAVHELVGRSIGLCLALTTLAWRDLMDHVSAVVHSLQTGSLDQARREVALVVGRDTDRLSEQEIIRAAVETVAESASDGVIAPLLYLAVGGAPLALAYKAVSTLDSMIGHRNERYKDFGWASARLDDLVNWLPARLTAWLTVVAAGLTQGAAHGARSAAILLRDAHKHPSPNSGRPEAALAGALGVQLGGVNTYDGVAEVRPHLGDAVDRLSIFHIARAKRIITTVYLLAVIAAVGYLSL